MSRPRGSSRSLLARNKVSENELIRAIKSFQEKQIPDPFAGSYGVGVNGERIIEPPYNPNALIRLPKESNILSACIDAMATNIEGHGGALAYVGPSGEEESAPAKQEWAYLYGLVQRPNPVSSMHTMLDRWRRDLETLGYACLEVGRDRRGKVSFIQHIPAHTVRIAVFDEEPVQATTTLVRYGKPQTVRHLRHFRRFVQIVGTERVWFKEFGDPRRIDPTTGKVNPALGDEQQATEIFFHSFYSQESPYGFPRWFGHITSVMGSRQAELTNLDFFTENAIPAMAVLVSGGMLTQSSIEAIEEHFAAGRGRRSLHRVLVLEAEGDSSSASLSGQIPQPKVQLEPLQRERQSDSLFQQYDAVNREKIRSAFRIPPLFVGLAQDYNHATARSGFQIAETQVFAPERRRTEEILKEIFGLPVYWEYRFRPPVLADPQDVIRGVQTFRSVGAISANTAIDLANSYFDLSIPKIDEPWADLPFTIIETLGRHNLLRGAFEAVSKDSSESLPIPQESPADVNSPDDRPPDLDLDK